jgi:nicotinamide mononucleotide adenylyltransferase
MSNNPNYEIKTDEDLSKFLLGTIRDVRKNELDVERATVISQLADKYTKNEIMRLLKKKMDKKDDGLDMIGETNKLLLTKVAE